MRITLLIAALIATGVAFEAVLENGFVNWDDPDVLVNNAALDGPGVIGWAFTTTHVGHYQPLGWLSWAALRRLAGTGAGAQHLASLLVHLVNVALLFALAARLLRSNPQPLLGALAAALMFGVHPLRVEVVAWASAFPYLLALAPLLAATLLHLRAVESGSGRDRALVGVLFVVSLLFRPIALGFPLALVALDFLLGRHRRCSPRSLVVKKLPLFAAAAAAGIAEASARSFIDLGRIGAGERLAAAVTAPLTYLRRILIPTGLTPLDALPLEAASPWPDLLGGVLGLGLLGTAAFLVRRRAPAVPLALLAWLALLFPALGLAPSGLQSTADRYTYVADVPLALLAGTAASALTRSWGPSLAATLVVTLGAGLGVASTRLIPVWQDSVRLWSHAVALDARNDVALYNLAVALEASGAEEEALARYDTLLGLVPEHAPARLNRDRLEARRLERAAGARAAGGDLDSAIDFYAQVLRLDPARTHSRRSRGIALAQLGRCTEAVPELERAVDEASEPDAWNALAYCAFAAGDLERAAATLRAGIARHPDNADLVRALNLLPK